MTAIGHPGRRRPRRPRPRRPRRPRPRRPRPRRPPRPPRPPHQPLERDLVISEQDLRRFAEAIWSEGVSFLYIVSHRPKLQVAREPFLAPMAVIFGVDFTGPHILCVSK